MPAIAARLGVGASQSRRWATGWLGWRRRWADLHARYPKPSPMSVTVGRASSPLWPAGFCTPAICLARFLLAPFWRALAGCWLRVRVPHRWALVTARWPMSISLLAKLNGRRSWRYLPILDARIRPHVCPLARLLRLLLLLMNMPSPPRRKRHTTTPMDRRIVSSLMS